MEFKINILEKQSKEGRKTDIYIFISLNNQNKSNKQSFEALGVVFFFSWVIGVHQLLSNFYLPGCSEEHNNTEGR